MDITFKDKKLRELCEKEAVANRQLAAARARKLRSRLADLRAALCVADLVAGRPHPLKGTRAGQYAVDLQGGCRLVFEPNHQPIPERADGGIDWSRVSSVRIVYIGDYHDQL